MCLYNTLYEEAVSGLTASNTQLFHYLLWEYHLLTSKFDVCGTMYRDIFLY